MGSSEGWRIWDWSKLIDRWHSRLLTAEAALALCAAQLLIRTIKFGRWRNTLGWTDECPLDQRASTSGKLARHVEWASRLIPFSTNCLPCAMALSWMLRSRRIGHSLVFAVRPEDKRGAADKLHAWVEISGETKIGNIPGPWVETLRLGSGHRGVD